jgi:hypothetical protein
VTEADKHEIRVTILEDGDQVRCAKTLAEHYPTTAKAELLGIMAELEPELRGMGFGPLSVLRAELERVHPAWGTP